MAKAKNPKRPSTKTRPVPRSGRTVVSTRAYFEGELVVEVALRRGEQPQAEFGPVTPGVTVEMGVEHVNPFGICSKRVTEAGRAPWSPTVPGVEDDGTVESPETAG
jgi:hypothetical protein